MTGEDLKLSGTRSDFDPDTGNPQVLMEFTDSGGDKFQRITRDEWSRGKIRGTPQHFAIVLDREIQSFPQIDFNDSTLSNGIGGGSARITGIDSVGEANDLAIVLQTGALPIEFQTLSTTEISATLGEDSLQQALRAAIAGMVVVAFFLLIFYRFLGVVAVIGLGIYAVFLYGVILLFNVTLTLPGFAGMILTIGVAADANIVIFERIKEESRAGKSVRAAISSGYAKGFATIVDANVVTAITAVILFVLATSGVRGFAFLLLLGTAISIVTAVFATRALLGLLAGASWFDNPAFMGASAREIPAWQRIDIVGRRRIWFAAASVLIVLSIGAIAVKGLNLGIDFEGGTEVTFRTAQPTELSEVRRLAGEVGEEGAQIQGVGDATGEAYREFKMRTETFEEGESERLQRALEREVGATGFGVTTVSASFSEQILRGAIYAMILSFALISLYITIRFQWRFAVPILRTIVNDGLIAVGVYAVSGREVTAATVAAFLTIIGYSIYDTIIIFDRVRENLSLMRRSPIAEIVNVSLWETIPRSLATTFITLLPVSALFFFGGETLKDFAFAILIGIGVSAFSTIFIAAPFLSVLMERHPDYKRRTETAPARPSAVVLQEAEAMAADEPVPAMVPAVSSGDGTSTDEAKRERRRQRRRARPHGRAR
jgi:SecD/SecF fusion protein